MRAICFLLQRTDHTEHIYQNSHIFSWKWCDETRLFTCWTGLQNISEFLFTKSGPQSWNWKWSVGSSSMCQSTRNYSMLWNLYISCSASLRALRSREPRGLQEKKNVLEQMTHTAGWTLCFLISLSPILLTPTQSPWRPWRGQFGHKTRFSFFSSTPSPSVPPSLFFF